MSIDLRTEYLGLELRNPIVASSSPLTGDLEHLHALEAAGVGAVVLPSLYEEQIEHDAMEMLRLTEFASESFAEALSGYHPELESYDFDTDRALEHLGEAKRTLSVPIIASLNGITRGGWVRHARDLEAAGADAIELNVYLIPTDPYATGGDVENRYIDLVTAVKEQVSIPLAVKIGPYFSSTANMARHLTDAGAGALVLFNRFYQPDIDLDGLRVVPNLHLSNPDELRLPLRWIAILRDSVRCDLAITSGVHSSEDALKALLVGADAVMMASALLRHGPEHVGTVLDEMIPWLEENEYESVNQMRGSMSLGSAPNAEAFVRSNYMKMLINYTPAKA